MTHLPTGPRRAGRLKGGLRVEHLVLTLQAGKGLGVPKICAGAANTNRTGLATTLKSKQPLF
jgi:hypothetical protein